MNDSAAEFSAALTDVFKRFAGVLLPAPASAVTPGRWKHDGKFMVSIPHKDGLICFRCAPEDGRAIAAVPELLAAAQAAVAYDEAIRRAAKERTITELQSVQGVDLDDLYMDWMAKSRIATAKALP